jgi:hypothetical protein
MADELRIGITISWSKGNANVKRAEHDEITITGDSFTHAVQSVGTSEEELTQHADLGTPGYVFVKNLDATNYVEIGSTTGVYDIKLLAGEMALYRHNSATVYAKANTSACLLEYIIFET